MIVDDSLSPTFSLGDALEVFVPREDAVRFVAEVRADDRKVARHRRIDERRLVLDGLN